VICRNERSVRYARPGMLMKVSALVSVATTEKRMAHHGIARSATK